MKELSIEEKAKAYDIALDKIKRLLGTGSSCSREELEYVFPELKESEDERIREELIEYHKAQAFFDGKPNNKHVKFVAWLERQGEQKPIENPCETCDHPMLNCQNFPCDKVGQKPAFEMKTPEESLGIDSDTYNKIVDECIYGDDKPTWSEEDEKIRKDLLYWLYSYKDGNETFVPAEDVDVWISYLEKQGEQKPVWSEEDENGLGDALWAIQQAMTIAKDENDMGNLWYAENWLKSLKDRVQPQPKQEWTMQDEEELQIALDTLVKAGQHSSAKWLKNVCLVPQSQWKPSDEQMLAINTAINVLGKGTLNGKQLVELQEQLKKL